MISMIAWTRMALMSEFRFWTNPALVVWASDVSDLSIVGYPLELLQDRSSFGATIKMRWLSSAEFPHALAPDLGVIIRWISAGGRCQWRWTRCSGECPEGGRHDRNTPNELGGVRSISRMNTMNFRLVQVLSWSNGTTSSNAVLCYGNIMSCLPQMSCGLLIL
jgi:hypothetical protein